MYGFSQKINKLMYGIKKKKKKTILVYEFKGEIKKNTFNTC